MAEIKYESKIGQINANASNVFAVLSNLENLQQFVNLIPQDKGDRDYPRHSTL